MCENNNTNFFVQLLEENNTGPFSGGICNFHGNLFDREQAHAIWDKSSDDFSIEYKNTVNAFIVNQKCNSFSAVVKNTIDLLKLIDINVYFNLDSASLAELLIALSYQIQALNTTYKNDKYDEYVWGHVIAFKTTLKVNAILTSNNSETVPEASKKFMIDTISKTPVTNTVLACWIDCSSKHYGLRVPRKVTQTVKALHLYDQLVGSGTKDLLLNKTKEQVEKKLKPFIDIERRDISDKILEFYLCKTNNEKKRFLSDIESFIRSIDLSLKNGINGFLTNN